MRLHFVSLVLVGAFTVSLTTTAAASTIGLDPVSGGGFSSTGLNSTRGFEFTVSTSLTVSALGLFDVDADGLGEAHNVFLWTSTGTLLASASVDSGDTAVDSAYAPADSQWLFASIAPFVLTPGTYVLGATYAIGSPDAFLAGTHPSPISVTTASGISWVGLRQAFANDTFPNGTLPGFTGTFGPSLLVEDSTPVPEPASLTLLGLGLAGIGARRWRQRKAS